MLIWNHLFKDNIIIFTVVVFIFLPMANVLIIKELICKYFASCVHLIIPLILTFRFLFLDIRKRNLQLYEKFYGGLPMLVYGLIMIILCGTKVLIFIINHGIFVSLLYYLYLFLDLVLVFYSII